LSMPDIQYESQVSELVFLQESTAFKVSR
jgi:hypothetical protein